MSFAELLAALTDAGNSAIEAKSLADQRAAELAAAQENDVSAKAGKKESDAALDAAFQSFKASL